MTATPTSFLLRVKKALRPSLVRFRQFEAARKQSRFVKTYVAVTGSCGKTTTTNLTALLLGAYGNSLKGGRNGGVGLLRTLRKLKAPVDYLTQETSVHMPGAMSLTVDALRVDVAVVTSIGYDHGASFRFPDIDVPDAIALEKGRLVEAVRPGGLACLNFDDTRTRAMASRTKEKVVGFGRAEDADVRAINVNARWPGRLSFDVIVHGKTHPVTTRFVGTMMLTNVLGALAVVHGLGFDIEPAIERLATIEPVWDRMGVHQGSDGKTYILDTEKAPYWSTSLLVDDLPNIGIDGVTFVLGEMSDIRSNSGAQYRKLIRVLSERVETVVLAGRAVDYGAKVLNEGLSNVVIAPTAVDVVKYLAGRPPGVVVLKSNKTLQLYRVLDHLVKLPRKTSDA